MLRAETSKRLVRELLSYLFAPVLIVVCYLMFHFLSTVSGDKTGYLLGMIFYWVFCCILPAFFWIDKTNRKLLFRIKRLNWWQWILLILPIVLAVLFGPFHERIRDATTVVIILSLPYAFINAFSEELLWRGVFFVRHQGNFFYAAIVPAVWFAVWHYVPLSILPASVGNFKFIVSALALGLCWGTVTYYTRSIFWSIISHTLLDFTGLGVIFYLSN